MSINSELSQEQNSNAPSPGRSSLGLLNPSFFKNSSPGKSSGIDLNNNTDLAMSPIELSEGNELDIQPLEVTDSKFSLRKVFSKNVEMNKTAKIKKKCKAILLKISNSNISVNEN